MLVELLYSTIVNKNKQKGFSMPRITKAQLIRLQKRFKTDAAIGDEFGITRQAVHQIRKKYGIESSLINNPQRNKIISQKFNEGTPVRILAKLHKISISQLYRIIYMDREEEERKAKKAKKDKKIDKKIVKKKENKKTGTKGTQKKAATKTDKKISKKPKKAKTKAGIV